MQPSSKTTTTTAMPSSNNSNNNNNGWQQQQPTLVNNNVFEQQQQQQSLQTAQHLSHQRLQPSATTNYTNISQHHCVKAPTNIYNKTIGGHQEGGNYFQEATVNAAKLANSVNFFDNSTNNNNNQSDGWSDCDWNDNNTLGQQQQFNDNSTTTNQQHQLPPSNVNTINVIAESFSPQSSQNDNWNWSTLAERSSKNVGINNKQKSDNWNWSTVENEQQQHQTTALATELSHVVLPSLATPPPPPSEFSTENHNYNTSAMLTSPTSSTLNNIPNSVFMSQAKPVTLPIRQYAASPLTGKASAGLEENTIMPPQGFQNPEEIPIHTVGASPPSSSNGTPPLIKIPSTSGNPFKRTGLPQHHRAAGFLPPVAANNQLFSMTAPPPPADFANPSTGNVNAMEPENNELPSQENQEVLPQPQNVLHSVALSAYPPQPLNDERNQYLKTSHLSENTTTHAEEEQQFETDGLMPPPGLSRLVLGEPELEANERLVTGTETPALNNTTTVMHLEERQADGEDTDTENNAIGTLDSAVTICTNSNVATNASDRNLYFVPGESQANNDQRVVTGVEIAEQREIELDGENLEDQQQQQQQQLPAESRNQPPVEGAADNVEPSNPTTLINNNYALNTVEDVLQSPTQLLNKGKDLLSNSSPNDDEESDERLLNERSHSTGTAIAAKTRSKYDVERVNSRRTTKRRSIDRYESDEEAYSEGEEYSSEREHEREMERHRHYRESSTRSDRGTGGADEDKPFIRRQRVNGDKRDKHYYQERERERERIERDRERKELTGKYEKRSQRYSNQERFEIGTKYETEESLRFDSRKDLSRRSIRYPDSERERARRSDRSDQGGEYNEYNRGRSFRSSKRGDDGRISERRRAVRDGVGLATDDYETNTIERRRGGRSDRPRDGRYREDPRYDLRDYEEYRKHSSRNTRESDVDKDGPRSARVHHDSRHMPGAMYTGYPTTAYDPYAAYFYGQMARTNPQAYAEWYKKYYGHTTATVMMPNILTGDQSSNANSAVEATRTTAGTDGRESVHSGRSSAHNGQRDRYTHAYITQSNEYQRHYHRRQQQRQQQMAFNQSLNSTMFTDDDSLNQNCDFYAGSVKPATGVSVGNIGGGRLSSANSHSNLSQIHGAYYANLSTSIIPATVTGGSYYARSDYADSTRTGPMSIHDIDTLTTEPQRLTPLKFLNEHAVINFASGILVTLKPKYAPNGNVNNVVNLLRCKPNDETRKLFRVFPGPLVRGLTHKKTIIEFCEEQIHLGPLDTTIYAKQLIVNNNERYKASYTLMWNLLILLLRQNGMVVGTDIAELLLKNQQQFPYESLLLAFESNNTSKSGSNTSEDLHSTDDILDDKELPLNKGTDLPIPENPVLVTGVEEKSAESSCSLLNDADVTDKFRQYLLYGNVNEALEWATDNNLWGHALFLASKLDRRTHANVMMKFANKLSLNDPLQTLYQLMSGRIPSSVTCLQDQKWGDWRPHLSMILSNTSQKPELDRRAITTLGDSLFNRGDLYAAHFCYLMAQVGFGRYQCTAIMETALQQHLPRLVLLGSSHYKQFNEFAHNEAIIMTEIYEYACSLNDEKFSLIEFQPYKFLLATRLLDYGYHLRSLMYLEQIALHISRDPTKYENSFIKKVYELADRLKFHDPVLEKPLDDHNAHQQMLQSHDDRDNLNTNFQQMEEKKWLQTLRELTQQNKANNDNNMAQSSENNAYNYQHQQQQQQQQQQQIDQQFMEINKQFSELNLQYEQHRHHNQTEQQASPAINNDTVYYNSDQSQQAQQPRKEPDHLLANTMTTPQQQTEFPATTNTNDLNLNSSIPTYDNSATSGLDSTSMPLIIGPQDIHQNQYAGSVATTSHYEQHQPSYYLTAEQLNSGAASGNYDFLSTGQQQQSLPQNLLDDMNARPPNISMPKTKIYDSDEDNANSNNRNKTTIGTKENKKINQQIVKLSKNEKDKGGNQSSSQNSGWFGGIWNKFSLKPKNQMILPDDKNPTIVWDAAEEKWVNTEGDGNEEESLKPPPKMSDLMPQAQHQPPQMPHPSQVPFIETQQHYTQQLQQQQQPQQPYLSNATVTSLPSNNTIFANPVAPVATVSAAPFNSTKTPHLQSNMFKMQRNRTLKNSYVDVFNPSGAPLSKAADNILAPALPSATVPQGGFLVPGAIPQQQATMQLNDTSGGYQQQQQQQQDVPQFYNPNQFNPNINDGSTY
ncbi:endoplasmic reticulum export factor secretory 16 isoform 1-T2 [Glossina fuscipes fuscipes]